MNLEFYNCPQPAQFDTKILPKEKPAFLDYRPDFSVMESVVKEYEQYPNILVIGHGGSVTSFYAFYNALKSTAQKKAYFLSSIDPDYISELKSTLSPADTLVLAITKSGENTTQIEALSQFWDYPIVVVTGEGSSVEQVAEKLGLRVVRHPVIGGRFTAFTETALLPALFCGLDIDGLYRGGKETHALYGQENLAYKAASVLWQLEQSGYVDVLGLVYSHYLYATMPLATQLCHESFGKNGKGQTYLFAEGSEVQHHTTQRFFGGRKNIAGWFIDVHNFTNQLVTSYPTSVHSVPFRKQPLFDLNKIPLQESQHAELQGTLEDAKLTGIPSVHMQLSAVEPVELGRFIAFWQLYVVYASLLRQVNPFDQPGVERGKQISFDKRLAYKGIL